MATICCQSVSITPNYPWHLWAVVPGRGGHRRWR